MEPADTIALAEQIQALPASQPHHANDLWMCGILACAFIMATVLSDRKHYLTHLLKNFFLPREYAIEGVRTTNIVYLRLSMYLVSLASTAVLLALYSSADASSGLSQGMLWFGIGIAVGVFYLLRRGLFAMTNRIFFDPATTKTWEQSYANWTILSSIPLFLMAVAVIFFNLTPKAILLVLAIGGGALEMCLLYKAFHIFSVKKYGILQIFIYLCTLELMPLLVAGKALVLFV